MSDAESETRPRDNRSRPSADRRHAIVTLKILPVCRAVCIILRWKLRAYLDIRSRERSAHRANAGTLLIERVIKYFFAGNAFVAVVVLALITLFLFREGFGFFGENLRELRLYRTAGFEYVDIMRAQAESTPRSIVGLNQIRLQRTQEPDSAPAEPTRKRRRRSPGSINSPIAFSDAGEELSGLVSDLE